MEIRQKLTVRFTSIVAVLLMGSLVAIYLLFSSYRSNDFRDRLEGKARTIGQLITEADSMDGAILQRIEKIEPSTLPGEQLFVFDHLNRPLWSSGEQEPASFSLKDIEMIRELKTVRYKERTSDIFGYHEERAGADLVIICSATDLFGMKKLSRLRFILASVFLVSLVVVYFTGRQFASGALEPISQLVREVDQIDITRISSRITTRGDSDEIAQLTDTFNKMLARLDTAFKFQKIFIPNASHELLTPLTAITGQLEVALMKDRDVEEYKATLGSVLEDIKSLNELTNRLLILTRLGGEHTPDKFNLVRIDEILWNSRSELIKRNKQFNINIFFTDFIQGEHHLNSNGNPTLLKTAFMNIIENGCKYSSDHRTDIYLSVIENACEILFKDEGIGIPGEDLDYIFHPFYRGGNVKNNKGHGIGLSLVESVILLHHGTISVNSKLKTGTEVRITLPLN